MSLPPVLYLAGAPVLFRSPLNVAPAEYAGRMLESRGHDAGSALAAFIGRLQDGTLAHVTEDWAARVIRVLVTGDEAGGCF